MQSTLIPCRGFAVFSLALLCSFNVPVGTAAESAVSTDDALERLVEGNHRFQADAGDHPHQKADRRHDTADHGQHPFAVVLSCADSRVAPELLFDQGIGDLFVVRVAGNVASTDEIATIEYGTEHLGAPLCIIMGHTKCGAVTAVVNGDHVGPNLAKLVAPIVPAANLARRENAGVTGSPLVAAAIRLNVQQAIENLLTNSETVRELVKEKKLKVVGALYDIQSGSVEFLGENPAQARLLAAASAAEHATKH